MSLVNIYLIHFLLLASHYYNPSLCRIQWCLLCPHPSARDLTVLSPISQYFLLSKLLKTVSSMKASKLLLSSSGEESSSALLFHEYQTCSFALLYGELLPLSIFIFFTIYLFWINKILFDIGRSKL